MTVNADDAVTDFPPFKHFLFLYKLLSDRQLVENLNGNMHYQIFCGIFLKNSSDKGMGSIASTVLYSDIHRITRSVFPSSERSLYRKRKCLKGGK